MVLGRKQIFVTDLIGDSYKNWKIGDKIIIASPTGSGKSAFILQSLLPYAMKQGKHVVYICNRKILNDQPTVESRKQIESILETTELTEEEIHSIHVTTYQHCETANSFPYFTIPPDLSGMSREARALAEASNTPPATKLPPEDILYYVFDEDHYFLSDALFNSNTNYWCGKKYKDTISVFLTATYEPLVCFLMRLRTDIYNEVGIVQEILGKYYRTSEVEGFSVTS